jgi:3-polyprenyl-4-hydroxybenzoate decarboxylase
MSLPLIIGISGASGAPYAADVVLKERRRLDQTVGRCLDLFDIDSGLVKPWPLTAKPGA